jgi:hypothetical protein
MGLFACIFWWVLRLVQHAGCWQVYGQQPYDLFKGLLLVAGFLWVAA